MSPVQGATGQNPVQETTVPMNLRKDPMRVRYPHLANYTDLNCVSRAQRGEFVEALLTMPACDVASWAKSRNRWALVDSFTD